MTAVIYDLAAARERMRRRNAAIAEAREARAIKIIRTIDTYFKLTGADLQTESAYVASELRRWDDAQWFAMGRYAGLEGFPSTETRALVIEQYEWMAKNRVDVRRSP